MNCVAFLGGGGGRQGTSAAASAVRPQARPLRVGVALRAVLLALGWTACSDGVGDSESAPASDVRSQPEVAAAAVPERLVDRVVLLSLDTLRADRLGFMGESRLTSPNLDGLARRAVVFEAARSQSSQTAPAHASLFTSLHPGAHGMVNVHAGDTESAVLPPGAVTLAERLAGTGIRSVAFVSGGNLTRTMGMDRGFASWNERNESAERRVSAFLEWEAGAGAEPYLALVHSYQVHAPYVPRRELADRFVNPEYRGSLRATYERYLALSDEEAWALGVGPDYWGPEMVNYTDEDVRFLSDLYDAEVAQLDAALRPLLERLLVGPKAARTAIVVLGDHGEEFREHGKFQHDQVFEELLHVPLAVFCGAELERAGWKGRVSVPVSLVDVAPTICDLLGVPAPDEPWRGKSLLPWLDPALRERATAQEAPPVFAELTREHRTHRYRAVVWRGWKYIEHRQLNKNLSWEFLHDLRSDPGERVNLIGSKEGDAPRMLALLRQALEQHVAADAALAEGLGQAAPSMLSEEQRRELEGLGYTGGAGGGR